MSGRVEKSIKWSVFGLALLFLLTAAHNISWGAPGIWHPDELAHRVIKALQGEWEFDTVMFDYPSLPKYVLYGVGLLVQKYGDPADYLVAMRFVSVILGCLVVALSFGLARRAGASPWFALLASALAASSSELLLNSSFAHNDIYLALFVGLATLTLVRYASTNERKWLYLSCLLIGLAASSKYNGISLMLVPIALFLAQGSKKSLQDWLWTVGVLVVSVILFVVGYAMGTPRSITALGYYFDNTIPVIQRYSIIGWAPGAQRGILMQWGKLNSALGFPFFMLAVVSILYFLIAITRDRFTQKAEMQDRSLRAAGVLLLVLGAYDLPFLSSYNVQPRYFLATIALFSVLAALFAEKLYSIFKEKGYVWANYALIVSAIGVVCFGILRCAGVVLSFANDPRIPASAYIQQLPEDISIEYTLYPPNIDQDRFYAAYNYPIKFLKFPGDELPYSPYFTFNSGEAGIETRRPDYLVIDSFTYARFSDEYVCQIHQADCDFFTRLLAGETSYRLVKSFEYDLPGYIPEVNLSFLGPDIKVYERTAP